MVMIILYLNWENFLYYLMTTILSEVCNENIFFRAILIGKETLRKLTDGYLLQSCSINCITCLLPSPLQKRATETPAINKINSGNDLVGKIFQMCFLDMQTSVVTR